MKYLGLVDVVYLHGQLIAQSGGSAGLRDQNGLESAIAQPRMTFGGVDLYPDIATKASALCFSLVLNHPFVDGNKRVGYAAMRLFLLLNGWMISADVDDAERTVLRLAAGELKRDELIAWIQSRITSLDRESI
jgi:death on curing protein